MKPVKIWLTDKAVHILDDNGIEREEQFVNYPGLRNATPQQLAEYEVSYFGLHWPKLGEDLAFDFFPLSPSKMKLQNSKSDYLRRNI